MRMKAQGRGIAGQGRFALGNLLVIVQVALSMVLIVGAGLFLRTFSLLATLPLGFDRRPVLVVAVNLQPLQLEPDVPVIPPRGCETQSPRRRACSTRRLGRDADERQHVG